MENSGYTSDEIDAMFQACLDQIQGGGREFIESLYEQWQKKGTLSDKQISSLSRFYENCKGL